MATGFGDQLGVLQTTANDAHDSNQEPARVGVLALVEPERLLIEVSEQVKRFDADIGPANGALEKRPEVFKAVGVNAVFDVAHSVIDFLVCVVRMQPVIRGQRVGIDRGAGFNMLVDFGGQRSTSRIRNRSRNDAAFAFQQTHDDGLADSTGAARRSPSLVAVHLVLGATDISFVDLDFASEFANRAVFESEADSMQHEPRGLLCDPKSTGKLARGDAILGVANHPEGGQPLVQTERAFLEYGADLHGGLHLTGAAAVQATFRHEHGVAGIAARACDLAVRPANRHHEVERVVRIREVLDCVFECLRKFRFLFHGAKLAQVMF